jgi:simple sugar transport system substrate-binding protein
MMRSLKKMAVGAAALALVLTACGTGGQAPEEGADGGGDAAGGASRDLNYAVVIHGVPDGSFWNVVKKGAEDGGAQYGVNVDVTGDPEGARQAQLIDSAVANQPDGIVVSMANPDALQGSIQAARDAGIPVITINSGEDRSAEFGALAHFGQSEGVAGEGVGERLKEEGAQKVVCLTRPATWASSSAARAWPTASAARSRTSRSTSTTPRASRPPCSPPSWATMRSTPSWA